MLPQGNTVTRGHAAAEHGRQGEQTAWRVPAAFSMMRLRAGAGAGRRCAPRTAVRSGCFGQQVTA